MPETHLEVSGGGTAAAAVCFTFVEKEERRLGPTHQPREATPQQGDPPQASQWSDFGPLLSSPPHLQRLHFQVGPMHTARGPEPERVFLGDTLEPATTGNALCSAPPGALAVSVHSKLRSNVTSPPCLHPPRLRWPSPRQALSPLHLSSWNWSLPATPHT